MTFETRSQWGARPAKSTAPFVTKEGIAIHWAGEHLNIRNHEQCKATVKSWQAMHMAPGGLGTKHGAADLAYNLVACQHGYVLEGRGASNQTGANGNYEANSRFASICYLGGVGNEIPTDGWNALLEAIRYLAGRGFPRIGYGHRDFIKTECPGDVIYRRIPSLFMGQAAPSPPTITTTREVRNVNIKFIEFKDVKLGDHGEGWKTADAPADRVLQPVQQGSHPPADDYWPICNFARQSRDGKTTIEITGGSPNQIISFSVPVLIDN